MNGKAMPPAANGGHTAKRGLDLSALDSSTILLVSQGGPTTPIFAAGKRVGHVSAGVFRKDVRGSVHRLRKPPAWALDVQSLADAEGAGAVRVSLQDVDTGLYHEAEISHIRRHGFVFDRGHGRQIALPLDKWQIRRPGETQARQLSLGFAT